MKDKKPKKYWYKYFHYYCPVCGKEEEYKERNYDTRPILYENRHISNKI